MKKVIYTGLLLLLGASFSQAQVGTGFEEPFAATAGQNYTDLNTTVAHQVPDNPIPQSSVNHGGATELGFSTFWTPTRPVPDNGGLSDGDQIGVFDNADVVNNFSPGAVFTGNGYEIEDTDGMLTFELETIDLSGTISPRFQMDLFVRSASYEMTNGVNDRLYIRIEIDGGASTIDIIDTDGGQSGGGSGGDLNTYLYLGTSLEGVVTNIDIDLSAFVGRTAKLILEWDCNSLSERMVFDNIQFTEGAKVGSLPIELSDFSGHHDQGNNIITWTTESEINNDYMILERSFDGLAFEPITQIEGFGSGTNISNTYYSYTDEGILKGKNYYRLLQIDMDGQQSLSRVIQISTPADRATILYPNPSKDKLVIRFNQKEEVLYRIYNRTGLLVKNGRLSANKYQHEVNVIDLIPGQYVLQIIEEENFENQRFIKR